MKKIIFVLIIFFVWIFTVYASITVAKNRKSSMIPWQWTWDIKYDPAHNVWASFELENTRFSFINWIEKWENVLVKDNITKLTWESSPSEIKRNWEDSMNYCNWLKKWWYNDWRLPTIQELITLVDYSRNQAPFVNINYFSIFYSGFWFWPKYWSSTEYLYSKYSKNEFWTLSFYSISNESLEKNKENYSICVRSDS